MAVGLLLPRVAARGGCLRLVASFPDRLPLPPLRDCDRLCGLGGLSPPSRTSADPVPATLTPPPSSTHACSHAHWTLLGDGLKPRPVINCGASVSSPLPEFGSRLIVGRQPPGYLARMASRTDDMYRQSEPPEGPVGGAHTTAPSSHSVSQNEEQQQQEKQQQSLSAALSGRSIAASPIIPHIGAGASASFNTASGKADTAIVEPFKRETMLELLRHVPMPVVVVTAAAWKAKPHYAPSPDAGSAATAVGGSAPMLGVEQSVHGGGQELLLRGITCSSFCSMSLAPPLVGVCIFNNSPFLQFVTHADAFCLHILTEANKDLASRFATKHSDLTISTFGSHAEADWELTNLNLPRDCSADSWSFLRGIEAQQTKGAAADGSAGGGGDEHAVPVPVIKGTMAALLCRKQAIQPVGDHCMLIGQVVATVSESFGDPLVYMNREYRHLGEAI